jgi:SulP family sulfate permease
VGFHLSEVKGPVMDALKRSDFFAHFKGRVFLSQYEAFSALRCKTDVTAKSGGQATSSDQCMPIASPIHAKPAV